MTDPYEVLNIPSTATDEEVKKAYRELARKYHPDNYHDNPLADLAQEKMKEINAAYDEIQRQRSGHGTAARQQRQSSYSSYGGWQYQQEREKDSTPLYQQARMAINRNDLNMAEQILTQVPVHDGEWNFLKGTICYRRGWIDEAHRYYETACQMEPGNAEYQQALNFVDNGQETYCPEGYGPFSTGGCTGDNVCGKLACTYLACNLCGYGGMRFFCC